MNQTTVTAGQSLVDVSVQELGSVAALFDLADAAGLAITDMLTPGQVLVVPASAASQPRIVAYFASRGQRVNTSDDGVAMTALTPDFDFPDFDNPDFDTN